MKNLSESKIVVISTHILEEVSFMCSRALVINGGRLLADNTPGELRTRSRYHHAVSLSIEAPVDPLAIAMLPASPVSKDAPTGRHPDHSGPPRRADPSRAQPPDPRQRLAGTGVRTEHGQLEEVFRQLTRETPA